MLKEDEMWIQRYRDGWTLEQIAQNHNFHRKMKNITGTISRGTVYRAIVKHPKTSDYFPLMEETLNEIHHLYLIEDKSTKEISELKNIPLAVLNHYIEKLKMKKPMRHMNRYIDREAIMESFQEEKCLEKIAEKHHASISTVYNVLQENGLIIRNSRKRTSLSEEEVKRIYERYRVGEKLIDLGKEYKVSNVSLRNEFRKHGYAIMQPNERKLIQR